MIFSTVPGKVALGFSAMEVSFDVPRDQYNSGIGLKALSRLTPSIESGRGTQLSDPNLRFPHPIVVMSLKTDGTVKKITETDLQVGLICADRDGNRIRIDSFDLDCDGEKLTYHFLNDELRVQEGVQQRSVEKFLAEGWYTASAGKSL